MKKRTRSIAAVLMAVLMTVGLIPADFTLVKAVAAETEYKFTPLTVATANSATTANTSMGAPIALDDKNPTKDGYFTFLSAKWEYRGSGAYAQGTGGGANLQFTVAEGKTATFTADLSATGGGNVALFTLKKGETVIEGAKDNPVTTDGSLFNGVGIKGTTSTTFKWENLPSGTYTLEVTDGNTADTSDSTKAKAYQCRVHGLSVVEKDASGGTSVTETYTYSADTHLTKLGLTGDVNKKAAVASGKVDSDKSGYSFNLAGSGFIRGNSGTLLLEVPSLYQGGFEFTVPDNSTANVVIKWCSTGGNNESKLELYKGAWTENSPGTVVGTRQSCTGTTLSEASYTDVGTGTYTIASPTDFLFDNGKGEQVSRGFRISSVAVTVTTSGEAITGTAPIITAATAALKAGTEDTVTVNWTVGTPADGSGKLVVEAWKDGSMVKDITPDDATATSTEYTMTSSGDYTFKVYGKLGGTSNAGVTTSPAITFKRDLAKPVATVKAGDAKIDISWKAVPEVTAYEVLIKDGSTEVAKETITDTKTTSFTKTGLTNLTTYTVTVTAVRGVEKAVSDEVSVTPYKPVDTSNAVPGMSVIDQSTDNAVSISRTAGKISLSQAATSGGASSGGTIKNVSFVLTPKAITGPFTMTADITPKDVNSAGSTSRGLFFGAFTGVEENAKLSTIAFRGDGKCRGYHTRPSGSNNAESPSDRAYEFGKKYTVTFSREESGTFSYKVNNGDTEVNAGTLTSHDDLKNGVKAGFYIFGASADVENMKITKGDGTVLFDSSKLTGEFASFQDNWDKVEAPVISVEGAKDKMTVTSNCEISQVGAGTVTVIMKDKDGKEVARQFSSKTGSSQTFEFAPEVSGKYTFVAEASRPSVETVKTSNEVSVDNFVATLKEPQGLTATSQGGGSVMLQWNAYGEATSWKVRYQAAGGAWSEYVTIADPKTTSYTVKGLTVDTKYTFEVVTVRGAEEKAATAEATATADSKFRWQFSAYGSSMSTKPEDTGYAGDANDGSVQVWNLNGKGKVVPNSTDGLAFYYTQIPTASNFILKAKVHVDEWTLSNAQDGFGVMVADRVGAHGDSTNFWNNSYQAIASKVEYSVDEQTGEISDAGKKITMKLGLGVTAKTGVTKENLDRLNASDTATVQNEFKTETVPLDTSAMNLAAGTYNVIPNGTNEVVTEGLPTVQDYYLTIQKNNTGYFVTYSDTNGNPIRTQKYYDTKAMSMVDEDYVYAGFFAARNAKATFSDISLELRDPADDPAPEEKPIKYVTPRYSVTSPKATGMSGYTFVFTTTASGLLTVEGLPNVENVWVEAGEKFTQKIELHGGDNYFGITFTPDPNFIPEKGDLLTSYEPYYFEHVVSYDGIGREGESIWVSPKGDPNGDGTEYYPVDIYTAVKYVKPGQQIILMGGRYELYKTINTERGNDGYSDKMIYMIADPNAEERPVLDFMWSCPGMVLAGNYWYFQGFDVTHSSNSQKGVQVSGSNNVLDQINAYHNGNTGIQISRLLSTDLWDDWPANNLILNCTSYGNADKGYEDADGFAAKLTIADGNVFDGCIAYNNADDGWDLFAKVETGSIGSVTIRNCVAYGNGYLEDGTNAGNGNGFKMGGDSLSGKHHLINSIAYNNKAKGIDSNSCPDIQVTSSTTFNNESYNVAFYTNTAANTDYVADGILSFRTEKLDQEEQLKPKGSQETGKYKGTTNYYWDAAKKQSLNTADAAASADWFVSLDTSVAPTRNADGTINMHGLLQLTDLAPEGVGARFEPTKSKDITALPSVYVEEEEKTEEPTTETPSVTDGLNVIGQNISVQAPAGTVIKNAAGQVVTSGNVFVKAAPVAANAADAEAILQVMKTDEIKIADNAGVDYFDVKLVDEAGNPLTFEGSIVITFAYPNGTSAASHAFTVLHLLANGKLDVMQPAVSDTGISVSVTELSPFAVVYAAKSADGSGSTVISAATGDRTPIVPIIVVLVASAIIICAGVIISKKRKA